MATFFIAYFLIIAGALMVASFLFLGVLPFGVARLFLSLARRERPPYYYLPYMIWAGSITALTLLSIVANWRTALMYDAGISNVFLVTIVQSALASVGILMCWLSFSDKRGTYAGEGALSGGAYAKAYIYWALWFVGLMLVNWVIDLSYALNAGVDIQGLGPGWIDLVEYITG